MTVIIRKYIFYFKLIIKYLFIKYKKSSIVSNYQDYDLSNDYFIKNFSVEVIMESAYANCRLPKSYPMCNGGAALMWHQPAYVLEIPDAVQVHNSDVVRHGSLAYLAKTENPNSFKEIFTDSDLVSRKNGALVLSNPSGVVEVDKGISLLGVGSSHWAHFLVDYMPRLHILRGHFSSVDTILLPSNADENIRDLVSFFTNDQVSLTYVEPQACVRANKLYTCSPIAYLCNHANFQSISDIVIPDKTREIIKNQMLDLSSAFWDSKKTTNRKVFIGFEGQRRPSNYYIIRDLLEANGYCTIYPHKLSLREKVNLFSSVEKVIGVGSSGFTNLLLCHNHVDAIALMNPERSLANYVSQFQPEYPSMNYELYVGENVGSFDINSEYLINIDKFSKFLSHRGFI